VNASPFKTSKAGRLCAPVLRCEPEGCHYTARPEIVEGGASTATVAHPRRRVPQRVLPGPPPPLQVGRAITTSRETWMTILPSR